MTRSQRIPAAPAVPPQSLITSGAPGVIPLGHVSALEKIPNAARRMSVSVSQFYRIAKRDGLRIIKVSERSSAVPAEDVDNWIQARLDLHANAVRAGKVGAK